MYSEGTDLLVRLSREIERVARQLAGAQETSSGLEGVDVRQLIKARRLRARFFGSELFADPAWDILLDLYAARLEGRHVSVSSLSIAADVPATTALRRIRTLEDRGLLVRSPDPKDARRIFIDLSDETANRMADYLRFAQSVTSLLV